MKRARGAGVVLVVVVCAGCSSDAPSMLDPHSLEARHISGLWWLMFALAAVVYIGVVGVVIAAVLRRRADLNEPLSPVEGDIPDRRDCTFLLIGGLIVPTVVLSIIAIQTVRVSEALSQQASTVHIDVVAEQWWWRVTYPDEGIVTANEIHVPLGEPVDISLRSNNVIHSFWVPQLNGKTDAVPGQTNHTAFTATTVGTFRGQCAEFCGVQHAKMSFLVVVQSPGDYRSWASANQQAAAQPQTDAQRGGATIFLTTSCAGCHTIAGTSAAGTLGPDLSHVGSRSTIAADSLDNDADQMTRWLEDTQQVKPGALMPQLDLTSEQTGSLVAYLQSLK